MPRCAGDIGPKGELYAVDTSEGATLEAWVIQGRDPHEIVHVTGACRRNEQSVAVAERR